MDEQELEQVTLNFTRKNWDAVQFEAMCSDMTETDVVNLAVAVLTQLRNETRTRKNTRVALLSRVKVIREPGKRAVVKLRKRSRAQLVTALNPEGAPK